MGNIIDEIETLVSQDHRVYYALVLDGVKIGVGRNPATRVRGYYGTLLGAEPCAPNEYSDPCEYGKSSTCLTERRLHNRYAVERVKPWREIFLGPEILKTVKKKFGWEPPPDRNLKVRAWEARLQVAEFEKKQLRDEIEILKRSRDPLRRAKRLVKDEIELHQQGYRSEHFLNRVLEELEMI